MTVGATGGDRGGDGLDRLGGHLQTEVVGRTWVMTVVSLGQLGPPGQTGALEEVGAAMVLLPSWSWW